MIQITENHFTRVGRLNRRFHVKGIPANINTKIIREKDGLNVTLILFFVFRAELCLTQTKT